MNITFFTLSMECGGAERVISNLCKAYISSGHQVNLITCFKENIGYHIDEKVNFIYLDESKEGQLQSLFTRFFRRRVILRKILSKLKTDIIISFLPEPCLLVTSLRSHIHIPVIISERNDPRNEYYKLIFRIAVKCLYQKADGCVFQTKDAQEYFNKKIQKNSIIIPNPINERFIGNTLVVERKNKIVSVGRLETQKNFPLLIKAFSNVNKIIPEYELVIYGEGSLKMELKELCIALKIENKVTLFGETKDVFNEIIDSSLFVLTSDYEGMPNALMEAMALGLPVIATDCPCGGVRYLIEDNCNGRLIPTGNQEELENAMLHLLQNKAFAEQLGDNALNIVNKVNPAEVYRQWEQYIQKMIEKKEKFK